MHLLLPVLGCSDYEVTGQTEDAPPGASAEATPDVEVDPLDVDFGEVRLGTDTDAAVVTITNVGDAVLGIDGVALAGDGPFTLGSVGAALLDPGGTTTFTVSYAPEEAAPHADEVLVSTTDPDEPTVSVLVHGEALAPDIVVDPAYYEFGTLDHGATAEVAITVSNDGSSALRVTELSYAANSEELTLDASATGELPWVILPGEAVSVVVAYVPVDDVADEGTLTVVSDDPDEASSDATQVGNARAWEGFSTGWYIVDDSTNYETTSNASYQVESYGDPDGYWYEPSGAHGLVGSSDTATDFATLHDYVVARAGEPTPVTGPLDFRTSSSVPAFTYASYSYVLCDFWIEADDDPDLYTVSAAAVDDGAEVIVNGQIVGYWYLGAAGSIEIGTALVPGEVNSLVVVLMDNSAVDKYLTQLAFYRDGVIVTSE